MEGGSAATSVILLRLLGLRSLERMALRSLLFSSDEETSQPIREVLTGLGVEAECCPDAAAAVEKLIHEAFQIVIIDWDKQPEAGLLLSTARDRKPAERPLTLAIVSNDAGVPKALQAGANSILRKPILVNQVKDTLKTARDLLRARQESAAAQAAAAAGAAAPSLPASPGAGSEPVLRAGEFLQSSGGPAAGTQFDVDSDFQKSLQQPSAAEVDPLAELEPMAAAVSQEQSVPPAAPPPPAGSNEPRGLEWYLNRRGGAKLPAPQMAAAAAPAPARAKPELIGFDQNPTSNSESATGTAWQSSVGAQEEAQEAEPASTGNAQAVREQKTEAELFAYIAGENQGAEEKESGPRRFRLNRGAIIAAAVLATGAIVAAPQAPWHASLKSAWGHGQQAVHGWLNPQPVTPPQAPASHEDFGRAGDEYKLPVAENIPDATTDPTQIRVVPVIDPTAKKPADAAGNPDQANPDQSTEPKDAAGTNPGDAGQTPAVQVQENPTPQAGVVTPGGTNAGGVAPANAPAAAGSPAVAASPRPETMVAVSSPKPALPPVTPRSSRPQPVSSTPAAAIPSSLKSQMASMAPEASGNKPVEAALPSIEPVNIPETAARSLLGDHPEPAYPANAKGQQGTVVLWVLIGRDGVVQDAKFLQGSLAFARAAIDGAKQWKFKPYSMNGRVVSVQTQLTISFKPGS